MPRVKRIMISLPDSLLNEVDVLAAAEQLNRSELIREAMKLYLAERKRMLLRDQMKRGYMEMAKINLAISIEHYRLEEEVAPFFELPVPEAK